MSQAGTEIFREVSLLADLGDDTLEQLAQLTRRAEFARGTTLFRRGEQPEFLYILLEGQVALLTGERGSGSTVVEVIDPVDCFVMATVLANARYLMSAHTLADSRLLCISAPGLLALVGADPQLGLKLLTGLGRQFRALVRQVADLKLRSTAQRLGCFLLEAERAQGGQGTVTLPYDKQTLAARLGASPEHLSRAFATLRSCGVVTRGPAIALSDPAALAAFARPDTIRDPRPLDPATAPGESSAA